MKVLINYADSKYRKAQKFCSFTGKYMAKFDKVIEYSPENIDVEFKRKHKNILDIESGGGLWLWKPYIILKTLKELNDNDFLFYCDSGSFFIRNIELIVKTMKGNIWVQDIPTIEKQWTKPDMFFLMGCNEEYYYNTQQIQGGFIGLIKCEETIKFIEEWLELCLNIELLDSKNRYIMPEDNSEFIENRNDQSIFSLLCKRHKIQPHKDPTQYGRLPEKYLIRENMYFSVNKHDDDKYKPLIVLHRSGELNKTVCLRQFLCASLPRDLGAKFIIKKYQQIKMKP